ncbi:hypothetical protein F5Y03DRAFT_371445 [Xylaria venustula]|nr:hypothetical protein F5Y03DRAFT_371445 [Xylaria venustula]
MSSSGIREWWRAQLDASPMNRSSSPSICPCVSCFDGTERASATKKKCSKHQLSSKRLGLLGSQVSVASDMVPLCTPATRTSRSSLESHS